MLVILRRAIALYIHWRFTNKPSTSAVDMETSNFLKYTIATLRDGVNEEPLLRPEGLIYLGIDDIDDKYES